MGSHVQRVRAACPEASRSLHGLILPNLGLARLAVRRCLARLGRSVEADDLFQEACIGLVRAAHQYDPSRGVRFSTYAFQCCWRACMDAARSPAQARRAGAAAHVQEDGPLDSAIAAGPSSEERASAAELWSLAMTRLNAAERAVLRLRFEQGQSYSAIARLWKCGRERVTGVERCALAKLRRRGGEKG